MILKFRGVSPDQVACLSNFADSVDNSDGEPLEASKHSLRPISLLKSPPSTNSRDFPGTTFNVELLIEELYEDKEGAVTKVPRSMVCRVFDILGRFPEESTPRSRMEPHHPDAGERYMVRGVDTGGSKKEVELVATDPEDAREKAKSQGLFPVKVTKLHQQPESALGR